jgi:hypothetical protein
MSRNFTASLKERRSDKREAPAWYIELALDAGVQGTNEGVITIDLQPGTLEANAQFLSSTLNRLGGRLRVGEP